MRLVASSRCRIRSGSAPPVVVRRPRVSRRTRAPSSLWAPGARPTSCGSRRSWSRRAGATSLRGSTWSVRRTSTFGQGCRLTPIHSDTNVKGGGHTRYTDEHTPTGPAPEAVRGRLVAQVARGLRDADNLYYERINGPYARTGIHGSGPRGVPPAQCKTFYGRLMEDWPTPATPRPAPGDRATRAASRAADSATVPSGCNYSSTHLDRSPPLEGRARQPYRLGE